MHGVDAWANAPQLCQSDLSEQGAVQAAFDAVLRMMGSSREEFTEQMKAAASDSPAEVRPTATRDPPCMLLFSADCFPQSLQGLYIVIGSVLFVSLPCLPCIL
jgi:hypothetical protein